MKKIFKRIHLWLSIPAGVLIMLICLTGAIMVFQTEIEETLHHERYFTEIPHGEKMNLDELAKQVNNQLISDTVVALKIHNDNSRNIVATLASGARVYAYVNPYNGHIVEVNNTRSGFFHNVMTLHRWLMFKNRPLGKIIIAISTIFFIIILITGVIRWFPSKQKKVSKSFSFRWKNVNGYRKILDIHKIIGASASIILITMALTGLMWSFEWYRNGVAKVLSIQPSQQKSGKPYPKMKQVEELEFWQPAFDKTISQVKNYNHITIHKSGDISILPTSALHSRKVNKYKYNQNDNIVKLISNFGQQKESSYMMSINYSIHVGSWGGLTTKIIWFIVALIGAGLPITGYLLYFKRR